MLSRSRSPRQERAQLPGWPEEEKLRNGHLAPSQGNGTASLDFRRSFTATTTTAATTATTPVIATATTTTTATSFTAAMSDEGYPTSNWEHTDSETLASSNLHHRNNNKQQPYHRSVDSLDIPAHTPLSPTKSPSPGRSSAESPTRNGASSKWRDSVLPSGGREAPTAEEAVVEASFDESVLRALCDLDVSGIFPTVLRPLVDRTLSFYASVGYRFC